MGGRPPLGAEFGAVPRAHWKCRDASSGALHGAGQTQSPVTLLLWGFSVAPPFVFKAQQGRKQLGVNKTVVFGEWRVQKSQHIGDCLPGLNMGGKTPSSVFIFMHFY